MHMHLIIGFPGASAAEAVTSFTRYEGTITRAVIYKGLGEIAVQDASVPVIGPKDVLVRNMRAGICGTDISAYLKGGDDLGIFPSG